MPGPQLCRRGPFSSSSAGRGLGPSAGRRGRRPLRWQPVDFPVAASAHGGQRAARKQLDKPKRDRLFQTVSLFFVVLSCRIIRIKVRQNPLAALAGVRHADGVAQGQNGARRDGELVHADGEEGFPGELKTTVTYHLTNENEVVISYQASTDKPTVLNLTNHSYFNLSGAGDPYIGDHLLTINADYYLPTDNTAIPYGPKEKVEGTPMDFRTPHEVGERINDNFEQLIFGKGYDHTYILNKEDNELSYCARCSSPKTGIVMETYTTQPGVQLYTGNWMTGNFEGKNGQRYPERAALCLETQHFPDSPNKPEYPTTELRPGEVFQSTTIYKFSVE